MNKILENLIAFIVFILILLIIEFFLIQVFGGGIISSGEIY